MSKLRAPRETLAAIKNPAPVTFVRQANVAHGPQQVNNDPPPPAEYLLQERKLAWSSCNIVTQGLKFFYHQTLKRRALEFQVPAARQPQKLPEILSREGDGAARRHQEPQAARCINDHLRGGAARFGGVRP